MDLGALPTIRCRSARIHQVIVNLLTNAIDACSAETGVVTVHTQTEPEAMGVRIDIQDNGCGIDPAIRERIFDPFFTTKPLGQGTGLGLSISYGIIEEHSGRIEVQSSPGEGACFTIHLPIEPPRKRGEEPAPNISSLDGRVDRTLPPTPSPRVEVAPQPLPASPPTSSGELAP